ncbi:MAG: DUF2460 domain-containing protein [Pseudomonadota bacterium]
MDSFSEERFPISIAFGATGGPRRRTEIVTLGSGKEHRNQRWQHSRRRFDAGYGVNTVDALHAVLAFYEARRGPLVGFRFRDPLDCKSCLPSASITAEDCRLGTGDGSTVRFSLAKVYGDGASAYLRPIKKPVSGTVSVALDGQPVQPSSFAVDATKGDLEFATPPAAGVAVTAGFEFDVPVRFENDELDINLVAFEAGDIPSIPLVEVIL